MVLDSYDRQVIGWAFSADLEAAHTTIPALDMAGDHRRAREGLIFHSDRGAQYCAQAFWDRLKEHHPMVRPSMSRKGNCSGLGRIFFQNVEKRVGNAGR
jgi:transposase InsO family protein